MNKNYTLKIVSNEGHTELTYETPEEAVERIIHEVSQNNKWVYVNNQALDKHEINVDVIKTSKEIVLTNPLIGG